MRQKNNTIQQKRTTPHYLGSYNVAHVVVILQTILFLYSVLTNQKICRRNMWPLLLKWPLFCVLRTSFVILFGLPIVLVKRQQNILVVGVVHIEWILNQPYWVRTYISHPPPRSKIHNMRLCVALALINVRYNGQWFSKCKFVYKVFLRGSVWFGSSLAVVTLRKEWERSEAPEKVIVHHMTHVHVCYYCDPMRARLYISIVCLRGGWLFTWQPYFM